MNDPYDRQLQDLLRDYPAPEAPAGFYDQAIARAAEQSIKRQRRRWMLTGFGSAIAASIAIWVMSSVLFTAPSLPQADETIPGITMALEEPRTVNLVFASADALDKATLTVLLPPGIELAGFPGQQEISWETSLAAGKNRLPLKLIALTPAGGEILARLQHNDRDREFRLRVDIS
jgi:hypothetical protein